MSEFSVKADIGAKEMSLAMTAQLVTGLNLILSLLPKISVWIMQDPCHFIPVFLSDPYNFILESIRLARLPLGTNAIIPPNKTFLLDCQGRNVEYRGGVPVAV